MSFLGGLGKKLEKGFSSAVHGGGKVVAEFQSGQTLSLFAPNNVVQLVSRSSGRALQIVQSTSGQLVLDVLGSAGGPCPSSPNACWTVVAYGKNHVSLHNNNNYIAIFNGQPCLRQYPAQPGKETKFLLYENKHETVSLESTSEGGRLVAFAANGGPVKDPYTKRSEPDAQFNVMLVTRSYSMSGPPPGPGVVPAGPAGAPPHQPPAGHVSSYMGDPRGAPMGYQPAPTGYPGGPPAGYAGGPPATGPYGAPAGYPGGPPATGPYGPPAGYAGGPPATGPYGAPAGYPAPPAEGTYPPPPPGGYPAGAPPPGGYPAGAPPPGGYPAGASGVYPSAPPPK